MQTLSLAVIGTGHLGTIHARLLQQQEGATLAAIVDPREEHGKQLAQEFNTTWYKSLDECQNIDAAIIAAPTLHHHDLAIECLQRGIHCFIEKPVTATYAQAQDLMKVAVTTQCVVQVGHVERFNPAVLSLAPYNLSPMFIEGHRLATFKPRAIDVSVVHDLMIHDIDLLLWITKAKVKSVHATGVAVLTDTPDICNARIEFNNGCVANITASRISAKPLRKFRVFQRDAYLSLDLAQGSVEMFRLIDATAIEPNHQQAISEIQTSHGNKTIVIDTPEVKAVNAIAEEQRSFLQSIRANADVKVTLEEGAEAVRIAEMIEEML